MFTPEIAEYVFVFLLITMVVDIFICILYPAYACLLYFSLYYTLKFKEYLFVDAPWIYLISILLFALMLVSYTYLWKYMHLILNKTFLKKSNAVYADKTVGSKGTLRILMESTSAIIIQICMPSKETHLTHQIILMETV